MSTVLLPPTPIRIPPPSGVSSLPIVELDRCDVETDHKQVRLRKGSKRRAAADCSFGTFCDSLSIDAWAFFHAAKKTELTTSFTAPFVDHRALCFAEEYKDLFTWNAPNLRRVDRSVFSLEDFAESGLAGRFGEAIAYLVMVKQGYVYWDRLAVLWERAASHSGMTHPEMVKSAKVLSSMIGRARPDLEPDFAFENIQGDVALMEAKGSFVHPTNDNPATKGDLRQALKQLGAWSGMVTPTPSKSFAIGTYFRDASDASGDPSLITFVDPPGETVAEMHPVDLPPDWIRRGNYGSWLIGMGYSESGNALRWARESPRQERNVLTTILNGQRYAFTISGVRLKPSSKLRFGWPWLVYFPIFDELFVDDHLRHPQILRDIGIAAFQVIGIESSTLRLIEESLDDPHAESLIQHETEQGQDSSIAPGRTSDGFTGSVFPDGTLLGEISPEQLAEAQMETYRV